MHPDRASRNCQEQNAFTPGIQKVTTEVSQCITPLVLTYNEEANIGRTLKSLSWARRIVVLDSGSTDSTEEITQGFENVSWFVRPFDRHDNQWKYGIHETGIDTEFAMALDADMATPPLLLRDIERRFLCGRYAGAMIPIHISYFGNRLSGSLCPRQLRLFRVADVKVAQSGHTQEFTVRGKTCRLTHGLFHDDQKPIDRWMDSQLRYSSLENQRLNRRSGLRIRDRIRRTGLMPLVVFPLAYILGGPFRGRSALRYALERAACECLLALRALDNQLRNESKR